MTTIWRHDGGAARQDDDKLHEECGVFGIIGHGEAAAHTVLGLHALQHRGQEGAGIVTTDGQNFFSHRALGLVGDNFSSEDVIKSLPGFMAIGHNRYSTTGGDRIRNVQPLFGDFAFGGFALGHNGNLTNAVSLRRRLVERGCLFQSTSDTEVIIHLVAKSRKPSVVDRLSDALMHVEGAYALVAMSSSMLIGVRDPLGVRPLVLGELDGATILTSESCALDIMGATFIRDVEPGEMVVVTRDGIESRQLFTPRPSRFCIFEYVYFARPDSMVEQESVYEVRKRIGAELAAENPAAVDIVIPVPDSGVSAAIGYAQAAGLPFELGLIRNHYVGRTFIEPSDQIRHFGVKLKHNANRATVHGKRVVLIDDSIVRGTTSTKIVAMIRQAGAKEVHMRIASPPTSHSCYYGVDTPERSKLLAAKHDLAGMAEVIGVDSLAFLSLDGLYRAVGNRTRDREQPQFCDACFSGDYPTSLEDVGNGEVADQLTLMLEDA
ncbi:MAG: amidophosphoribosyltransferase [Geminicoccaceae bacterium]